MKWHLQRRRKSLLTRLLSANLLVAVVSMVSLTLLFLLSYQAEFQRQQLLRAQALADLVARQSEVSALVGDRAALEKIAGNALSGEDVLFVRISYGGAAGDVVAQLSGFHTAGSAGRSGEPAFVEAIEEMRAGRGALLDWEESLPRQSESIGVVHLGLSLAKQEALFRRAVQQSLLMAGLLLAGILTVQFVRIRKLLRPLEELIAFTQRVDIGDLSERAPVDQVHQIADVAVAFNQMLDRLSRTTVSRDYVDNIIHCMAECLIVVGRDGCIRTVNDAALTLLDYTEGELVGRPAAILSRAQTSTLMRPIVAIEQEWLTQDGRSIPVLFSSAALKGKDAGEEGFVWLAQNMTEQKRVREQLIAARERYALAVAGANDGIWDWNVLTGEVYYSPRWMSMLGYEETEITGQLSTWLSLVHPDDRGRVEGELEAHRIGASKMFESEHRTRHCDGAYRWMRVRGLAVRAPNGTASRMAGSQTDITQNKVSDSLTGLPNRVLFTEQLMRAFDRRRRNPEYGLAVLFLDLDRFKMINDSMGHLAGDRLLIGIADRVRTGVAAELGDTEHTVARLSGDEFAVLLEGMSKERAASTASRVGNRLVADLARPFLIEGRQVFSSVSIGIAEDNGDYTSPSEMLRDSDIAMYRAKAMGKSRCEVFGSDMRAQAVARLELDTDLRRAIEQNEFVVYYQPLFSVADERIQGFEALVRWRHPQRGLIAPVEFIPVAEETGLILPLGAMVLREACRQAHEWETLYPAQCPIQLSVNISPRQFLEPGLPCLVESVLKETGLSPQSLALEVTETVLIRDVEMALETLTGLKALGVGLMIDDFGTGYSSLNYLHRFPFDTVKIDRSFVGNLEHEGGAAIVRTIIALADNLGMEVVAEGVETARQIRILQNLGCQYGQGYYFSRPVPAEVAQILLAEAPDKRSNDLEILKERLSSPIEASAKIGK